MPATDNKFCFLSLGSSSSGNCYFVGTSDYGFLIDAGVSVRTVKKVCKDNGIDFSHIYGIFITHAHTDHVKYVGVLAEKYNLPIYTTQGVFDGINGNVRITPKISSHNRRVFCKSDKIAIRDFVVQSFPVSHDASDAMGYSVLFNNQTLVIATDLGYISRDVSDNIARANYLVIEANYDEEMLKNGNYNYTLKQRVRSHTGHLSNEHTARFLADNWHDNLTHLFLCHVSGENNTPELAYGTVGDALKEKNISPKLFVVLDRLAPSPMFVLE